MKVRTVLVGVKLQPDQHPKTLVIHKVGGYGSGSDIGRGLYALADTWDGGHAGPTSFSTKLCGIRQKSKILHSDFGSKVSGEGLIRSPVWVSFLLCSAVSKYLGHFPECLVEFHILIDALECPALGHPATIRAAAGPVALTTANDVFLDTVERGPEIFGSISITSWIKEHGGIYRGFREVFPPISRRASGQSELFDIGQNALLKELHFVHDVRDSIEDFERGLDHEVGIEPGMFD